MIEILRTICNLHEIPVQNAERLAGGDINEVYKIVSYNSTYVLKLNSLHPYPDMFLIEAKSLEILSKSDSFIIPEVIAQGEYKAFKYLILEFIEPVSLKHFSNEFAISLAKLHKHSAPKFGLNFDNYIGSLPQKNTQTYPDASSFYIHLRLEPQIKLAEAKGYRFKTINKLYSVVKDIVPNEKPSLIHGDLWAGNYLTTSENRVCLIDPAIAYAPREMDIAMMQLFGGFPHDIIAIYNEIFPLKSGWKERIKLWQLYYILVHVNLFGGHYYNSAQEIINAYTT